VVQLILALVFFGYLREFLQNQSDLLSSGSSVGFTAMVVSPLLGFAVVLLLLVSPLISMRLFSEERRNKTLSLLVSAPISMTEIVLGKYLSLVIFLWIILGMALLMPLSLLVGGWLDFGLFAAGALGLALLLAGFAAVGVFMSTLTQYQTVAAVSTFGMLLLFLLLELAGAALGGASVLTYLSLLTHYQPFLRGMFDTRDAVYLILFIATFLTLSVRRLDMDRLGG
jgi:ABC-2 type transport system permease protein